MQIDRRITNGLAWAGVLLVVGVPVADYLSAQFLGDPRAEGAQQVAVLAPEDVQVAPVPAPASQRPVAAVSKPAPVEVAVAQPVAKPAASAESKPVAAPAAKLTTPAARPTGNAVDDFVQSGRPLPSYITDAQSAATPTQQAAAPTAKTPTVAAPVAAAPTAVTSVAAVPTPATIDPVEVSAIPPQVSAPVPMPLSMRPRPVAVALVPPSPVGEQPELVIPPNLARAPVPPAPVVGPAEVTAADLEDWETGPLSDFLAERQGQRSAASAPSDYDADGFFLDEGPQPTGDRLIGREVEPFFFYAD